MKNKLLTLKDFDKTLVGYLYEKDQQVAKINYKMSGLEAYIETIKGKKIGVVIAIDSNVLGWSLCNTKIREEVTIEDGAVIVQKIPNDTFNKSEGISKALQRADIASTLSTRERESFYRKVPFSIQELFNKMNERSEQYFKYND